MRKSQQIIIAMSAQGVLTIDQIKVGEIIMDNQAHRLLLRRAHDEGIKLPEALEKTLTEAIREYISENTIV